MDTKIEPKKAQPSAEQPLSLQISIAAAYWGYAQALQGGQLELQKDDSELTANYFKLLQQVQKELEQRGVKAYRNFIDGLTAAAGENEPYRRTAQAYQDYLAAWQEVWIEREKQPYAGSLQETGNLLNLQKRAEDAQDTYLRLLTEAQDYSRSRAEAAYLTFLQDLWSAWQEARVQEQYHKALQAYLDGLSGVWTNYQNLLMNASHELLKAMPNAGESEHFIFGKHTYYGPDIQLRAYLPGEKVIIGNYCSIADRVIISTGGMRRTDVAALYPFSLNAHKPTPNTTIGNDVWIGSGVTVTGGVQVGDGAILASEAVIFEDVPPFAVVAGNPAKVIRYRFSKSIVERLLRIAWWYWPDEKIKANLDWFYKPIQEFVDHFDPQEEGSGNG